jgi:hypothetical protein
MGLSGVGMWGDIGVKKRSEERCSLCLRSQTLSASWLGEVRRCGNRFWRNNY